MSVDGNWNLTVQTLMGAQSSTVELVADGSNLTGTQSGNGESGPIYDGHVDGDTASWKVDITRPMPLTVSFTATVDGESIAGTAHAGGFPPAPFSGSRA
jgi:hypothetical protein